MNHSTAVALQPHRKRGGRGWEVRAWGRSVVVVVAAMAGLALPPLPSMGRVVGECTVQHCLPQLLR